MIVITVVAKNKFDMLFIHNNYDGLITVWKKS